MEEKPPAGGFSFGVLPKVKLHSLIALGGVEPERSWNHVKA
jgi:hypothetical protein